MGIQSGYRLTAYRLPDGQERSGLASGASASRSRWPGAAGATGLRVSGSLQPEACSLFYSSYALNNSDALVPPKPNEFDSA